MQKFNVKTENFIKSYRVLRALPLTITEINLIELVLSYQSSGLDFYESDKTISQYIITSEGGSRNLISKLAKLGYIDKNTIVNSVKGSYGGKTRFLTVNIDYINQVLSGIEDEVIEESIQPIIIEETPEIEEAKVIIQVEEVNEPIVFGQDDEHEDLISQEQLQLLMQGAAEIKDGEIIVIPQEERILTKDQIRKEFSNMLFKYSFEGKELTKVRDLVCNATKYTDEEYTQYYNEILLTLPENV